MEEFKGTPGSWHYDKELDGVYSSSCRFICDVTDSRNGILIAAAPELLESLQQCVEWLDIHAPAGSAESFCVDEAKAAIAKALGK